MPHILDTTRFAPEKALVDELFERFGLDDLIAHFVESGGTAPMYEYVLSTQLRLTPVLAPRLTGLLDEARERLGFEGAVDLFVASDSDVNAYALHATTEGTPHAVSLTSALVERMDDDELRFVLGHELGHLHHAHYRALLALQAFGENEAGDSLAPPLLRSRMGTWGRLAELSADRAGFLAAGGNLEAVVSAFFKLASGLGPEHLRFDIDAFLAQLAEIQKMQRREIMASYSHPITPVRVRALQIYAEAGAHEASKRRHAAADREIEVLARLMDREVTEPLPVHARDFLLAGGMLAAHADGEDVTHEQWEFLVQTLLPLSADPEAQLARLETVEQAEALLDDSLTWLAENAGEERYGLFRELANVVALDGRIQGGEEPFMMAVAERLGIPEKAAKETLYEVLAGYLQSKALNQTVIPGFGRRRKRKAG